MSLFWSFVFWTHCFNFFGEFFLYTEQQRTEKVIPNFHLELSAIFRGGFLHALYCMPWPIALTDDLQRCRVGDVVRVQPLGYRLGPWKTCAIRWLPRGWKPQGSLGIPRWDGSFQDIWRSTWLGSPPFISHFLGHLEGVSRWDVPTEDHPMTPWLTRQVRPGAHSPPRSPWCLEGPGRRRCSKLYVDRFRIECVSWRVIFSLWLVENQSIRF